LPTNKEFSRLSTTRFIAHLFGLLLQREQPAQHGDYFAGDLRGGALGGGLMILTEGVRYWSMRLNGPRWSRASVKWEMSAQTL
jgi:hypothetical protein